MSRFKTILVFVPLFFLAYACGDSGTPKLVVKGSGSAADDSAKFTSFMTMAPITAGSPTSEKNLFYKLYISLNADCSDPILIMDYGAAGQEFDLIENPTLYSGSPADGSYNCLIVEQSDNMKFKVDSVAAEAFPASCSDTNPDYYVYDIYRSDDDDANLWIDINGDVITATGTASSPGNDTVYTYSSTTDDPSIIKMNGVTIHPHQYTYMATPLVVPGQTTMYIDFTGKVSEFGGPDSGICWLEQPEMGFR